MTNNIKKKWDLATIGLAILAGGESVHAFSSTMPSHFTIRSFALKDGGEYGGTVDEKLADLRSGYKPAIAWAAIFGIGAGLLSRSWLPVLASAIAAGGMVLSYESALPEDLRMNWLDHIELIGHGATWVLPEVLL